jgi:hypothetical protein
MREWREAGKENAMGSLHSGEGRGLGNGSVCVCICLEPLAELWEERGETLMERPEEKMKNNRPCMLV